MLEVPATHDLSWNPDAALSLLLLSTVSSLLSVILLYYVKMPQYHPFIKSENIKLLKKRFK